MLRRILACALLIILSSQAIAAVADAACVLSGGCPMEKQMQMQDMHESGCDHGEPAPAHSTSHLPCGMDHCPLLASPAMLTPLVAVFAPPGRSPQQTLVSSAFQSADSHGLLRPPRLST